MAFSFSNWFKTKPGDEAAESDAPSATAQAPEPEAATPESARAATGSAPGASSVSVSAATPEAPRPRQVPSLKSVVPKSVRPVGVRENAIRPVTPMPLPNATNPLRMPGSGQVATFPTPQARPIAFSGGGIGLPQPILTTSPSGSGQGLGLSGAAQHAAAAAPEPAPALQAPNVALNLELGDFVDKIPANLLKNGLLDRQRIVPFKARDLFSDLSRGRAAVSASAIYALCPDIFVGPITDAEDVEVPLPLHKLVEQLSASLQPRADQVAEESVGEIETPFLQVALEDSARFPQAAPSPAPASTPAAKAPPASIPTPSPRASEPETPRPQPVKITQSPAQPAAAKPPAPVPATPAAATAPAPAPAPTVPMTPIPAARPVPAPSPVEAAPVQSAPAPRPTPLPHAIAPTPEPPAPSPAEEMRAMPGPATHPSPATEFPAPPPAIAGGPIGVMKRPPSTVRASVAGGKIRLSGPVMQTRGISLVPPTAPGTAAARQAPIAPRPPAPPVLVKPIATAAAPAGPEATSIKSLLKRTARIQMPSINVLPGSQAPASLRPTAPTTPSPAGGSVQAKAAPVMPNFRNSPGGGPQARPLPGAPPPPIGFKPAVSLPSLPVSGVTARLQIPPPAVPFAPPPSAPQAAPAPTAAKIIEPKPEAPTPTVAPEPVVQPVDIPPLAVVPPAATADQGLIQLSLASILRSLPSTFLANAASAAAIPDEVRVAVPLAQITPQLAHGRVSLTRAIFEAGLPEAYREVLAPGEEPAEIPLPLQEIFQNLPTGALSQRQDQFIEEVGPVIPTPFSQKAEEDAAALRAISATPPAASTESTPAVPETETPAPATGVLAQELAPEPVIGLAAPELEDEVAEARHEPVEAAFDQAAPPEAIEEPAAMSAALAAPMEPEATEAAPAHVAPATEPIPEELVAAEVQAGPAPVEAHDVPAPVEAPDVPAPVEVPSVPAPVEEPQAAAPAPVETPQAVVAPIAPVIAEIPPAQPAPEPTPSPTAAESAAARKAQIDSAQEALREVFMLDEDFDAKKVVKLASQLPGLTACTIMFTDGLKLAGNFSADLEGEGFCAMTPAFFQKARTFTRELNLGELSDFTIHTERGLLMSFFMHEDICVSVSHSGRGFLPGVREKLQNVTRQLAALYSTKS